MFRRDKSRNHANPTARARRIRDAERRERERIASGGSPEAPYDREQIRRWQFDDAEPAPARATGSAGAPRAARRRAPIGRILLIGFVLVLVLAVIGSVLLWQRVSAFNDSVSTAPAMSSALWGPLGGKDRVNIVLFGYGGSEHKSGNYLADSIQILSIDPQNDTTTMIPIPRDLWVEGMPELPDNAKINEAFADGYADGGIPGAAEFATSVLARVTGLQLDHWMAIDFTGFEEMVDAVGGVTIRNPRAFRFTWNEIKFRQGRWDGGRFKRGYIELDGKRALDYARARYTSVPRESSDFARSVRQQRVLAALRGKMGSGGIGSIGPGLSMMDALDGKMMTDLSAFDLFLLSSHLDPDRRIELKEGKILEATTNTIGQYILVVIGRSSSTDYAPLHDYLARELAKPIPKHPPRATGS